MAGGRFSEPRRRRVLLLVLGPTVLASVAALVVARQLLPGESQAARAVAQSEVPDDGSSTPSPDEDEDEPGWE